MRQTAKLVVIALTVMGGVMSQAAAQSASSSNPFSGLSRLFGGGGEKPVTTEDGRVLGPPTELQVMVVDGDDDLRDPVRSASLVASALAEDRNTGQDMLAAARGDYARVLGVMYDEGYFSAIINITLDGVEAAGIAPLDAPKYVGKVVIAVDPGPRFKFARAELAPLAPGTRPDPDYAVGETAGTGIIKRATTSAIRDWRDASHAKARVEGQQIIADHNAAALESSVALHPGPPVTFGRLNASGNERLSTRRLLKIAGYPEGRPFDPDELETVRKRLRRAGVFSAITLVEADSLNPDNSMDIDLKVVEQKPRRIGAAFEISNVDGASLSAYWLHRNLLGGGERFRIEAAVSDIKVDGDGRDYSFGMRIDRPATLSPDTTGYIDLQLSEDNEPDYYLRSGSFALGFNYIKSDRLTADIAVAFVRQRINYGSERYDYRVVSLPGKITWDRRDDLKNAKRGFYLQGGATPFKGFSGTGSGAQLTGEARVYRSMLSDDRLTFAARGRAGTVLGPTIIDTPPDYLFFSGGGGSVRGQPFESLGFRVPIPDTTETAYVGGQSLVNASMEARFQVREKIGAVAFLDASQIWDDGAWKGETKWHAGAGVGVRYDTPIGPLRFDVATPIHGNDEDSKVQLYLGLGQAF
ncbi:autotransporter assembly complex protein TamA [Paracoccus jeotgali]|uniref:autotransporter assembly complex protein TamA n=1 Tax=Paracoccus jeotgali TaxID=2065379 RepID=UPI0028AA8772|nr:autotransporter assembly complex family protein [Paracoccus jeotgali]